MAGEKAKKKAASKPSKPTCFAMVCAAIKAKKGTFGKGVSRAFIYSHIGDNHSGTAVAAVRRASRPSGPDHETPCLECSHRARVQTELGSVDDSATVDLTARAKGRMQDGGMSTREYRKRTRQCEPSENPSAATAATSRLDCTSY